MNNEEKRSYIKDIHKHRVELNPYDESFPFEEKKKKENQLYEIFLDNFYGLVPKHFYRYRKANKDNINDVKNNTAWFSKPSSFGDLVDFTINTDLEAEMKDLEEHSDEINKKLAITFINLWLKPYGTTVNENMVEEALKIFNEDGTVGKEAAFNFLSQKMPSYASDSYANKLVNATDPNNQTEVLKAVKGFFDYYKDLNTRIRNETYVLCLAEENDNIPMWELYAENETGFCIEYEFPKEKFIGQRVLLNLLPMYYGDKEQIKFFDVLINSLTADKLINGISIDDYSRWFLSSYTKDPGYAFQKEWRIVFTEEMGGNSQRFPFAKSITLGAKISPENKETLIEIAKHNNLTVYERRLNLSGSKIKIIKIL